MATEVVQDTSIQRQDSSFVHSESVPQDEKKSAVISEGYVSSSEDLAPLGDPIEERRFWFQRATRYDPNAIATQRSVFDDPELAKHNMPGPKWENRHRFDPSARWTWGEEQHLVQKIDYKIMIFACIMFMSLELDRSNLSQALTDNFLGDLGMTTHDYNLGNTVFYTSFLLAELPSQLVSKWVGPDRWIPTQMVLWSAVASGQFGLRGRASFLATRALLGILQGGFIPDMILYLSYFYKANELSLRLSFWWASIYGADIIASLLGFAFLHLRGHDGKAGWRWLFFIEGFFTLIMGLAAFVLMPASPTQTASRLRGKKGWFTEREEIILVNRVIRDDPSKGSMHNREAITPRLLWASLKDFDLWQLYIIVLMFFVPTTPVGQYLTLALVELGFGTFKTNLLVIPSTVLSATTLIIVTYVSEIVDERSLIGLFRQVWAVPFLIWLYVVDITTVNKWVVWTVITLLLSFPSAHAIQVGWCSRNSNTVRTRAVSAAMYNMFVQISSIIASNIYRADDAPRYRKGNKILIGIAVCNIFIYLLTKIWYLYRNKTGETKWQALNLEEKTHYLETTTDEGNKRLDFRFAH